MKKYNDFPMWKDVTEEEWTDWKWQLGHCITSVDELSCFIELSEKERQDISKVNKDFKMRISPHIALMMANGSINDTLRIQFIPSIKEAETADEVLLHDDVNADDSYTKVKGLVHRYPTKVLVFPSNFCGCYCRYCFRRKLKREKETRLTMDDYNNIFDYLKKHPQINEVIFSGGDPLVVEDEVFEKVIKELSNISNIKIVRFHTRMVITDPYRINNSFINMLKSFGRRFAFYMVIHIDTLHEFSKEAKDAVDLLVDNGIMCFASCPLLHGINDNEETLKELWNGLVENRVKPYYLFQSDPVKGLGHFLVPLSRGLEITRNLYDSMSGLSMPLYCFNVPDGGGHILITYPYITKKSEHVYELENFEGKKYTYNELEYKESVQL